MTATKPRFSKTCPVCNSTSRKLFDIDHYVIRSCQVCAHQFTEKQPDSEHVEDVYNDAYFKGKEWGYPNYLAEGKFLKIKGRRYAKLISRYIKKPGRMLDVGAAAGFILQGFSDRDWKGSGVEPNGRMVEHAEKVGLRMTQGTMEEFRTTEKYDLVTMIQVIAHLTNLQDAFRVAADATQSNGLWLIETGNRDSFKARLSGENWREYHPPSTLHWFSPKDLQRLVAQYGFREIARGKPRKWVNAAHAKFALRQSKGTLWTALVLLVLMIIPDRFPIPYPASDQFWVIYRKIW
jgi:2-polyprenyl-3-methyl-5-hydroxy-6-metoxy-1,4-benzoquinol methylase